MDFDALVSLKLDSTESSMAPKCILTIRIKDMSKIVTMYFVLGETAST